MKANEPPRQAERLSALRALGILDTPRERRFDEIVELASRICDTPISVVNLIDEDRQWFKAEVGLGVRETPLDSSICAHAILQPGLTVIPDTLRDPRLADNPLCIGAPHLRFYAGALLTSPEGYPLGTLCVLDHEPRNLDETQRFALEVLARQVMTQMRLTRVAEDERNARAFADERARALEAAVKSQEVLRGEIDHRVKNSLQMVGSILALQARDAGSEEAAGELTVARDRVQAIALLHEQLHISASADRVDMHAFLNRLAASLRTALPSNVTLDLDVDPIVVDTRRASSLGIVVNELVANSIKHAFPEGEGGLIAIRLDADGDRVRLDVSDSGVGPRDGAGDGAGPSGRPGLGMRLVRACVSQLEGEMVPENSSAPGTRFAVIMPLNPG